MIKESAPSLLIKIKRFSMSNLISGTNIGLTESLKTHIKKNISKLNHFDSNITNTHVIIKKDADKYVAEVVLHSSIVKGEIMTDCKSDDMYTAINSASRKMITRLKKYNGKVKTKH